MTNEFVLHSLRHTMLTRLGESGVDVFTIMKIAGHSSVTISQRYVHPSPEAVECAFDRLERLNRVEAGRSTAAVAEGPQATKRQLPATISATVIENLL